MKIAGGTLLTEDLAFRTLKRRTAFGPFPDLAAARRELLTTDGLPSGGLGDFGRGGETVRRALLTALLTAWDAGGAIPPETGVFGWNGDGCTAENLAYWRDYVGNGRAAGRGGLFVATLPTIPYCEAAIALGCRGGVAYCRTPRNTSHLRTLLAAAKPGTYLCGEITRSSVCMILADARREGDLPQDAATLEELFLMLEGGR